ncbi:MAG: DNA primase [Chlamydiae bacterium]|nr:DNA primase [Chlamydiota bacterium]
MEIKRSGAYHKANCPFHEEKTPSFVVQPGSSFYHCFGCQAHGDAIAFLMEHQHLSFTEAVEFLAQRYGVVLDYDQTAPQTQNKKKLLDALAIANRFFNKQLLESQEGKEAREYLEKRGIDQSFIKKFEVGLAPIDGKKLAKILLDEKYLASELQEIGLFNQYNSTFFYDRITFPIRSSQGAVIGFSARVFKEGATGGKYINSKESFLFKKSNVLFGLNYSRMRLAKGKKALLVEGQIDALRLIEHGLNATIAPLGTALTENHVDKLLQLGVEQAYLAFDSDDAGINAAIKSGHLLQKKKITTCIVPLPAGSDPDSYLQKNGAKGFAELLKQKISYLAFLMRVFSKRVDLSDPAQKARVVEKITKNIREWEDPVMVHESLKKMASIMQIPESALGLSEITPPHIYAASTASLKNSSAPTQQYLETEVLIWLLQRDLPTEEFFKIAQDNISKDLFEDSKCQSIYQILCDGFAQKSAPDSLSLLIECPDEETQSLVASLMEKKINKEHAKKLFVSALQRFLDHQWMKKRESIKLKIQSGVLSDDQALELAKEFDEIQKQRPQVKQ